MFSVICAPASGPAPAAISILRLSGEGCAGVLDGLFAAKCGKKASERMPGKLYYGTLSDKNAQPVDLCMAVFFRAPASYTGEDMAEIHIHGSEAVMSAALEACAALGCRLAEPGEFTRRAFLNQKLDLISAEATADLINAPTAAAARNAVMLLRGAMGKELADMRSALLGICAHYYAVCDHPDEDLDPFSYREAGERLCRFAVRLKELRATYERGRLIQNGIPVAVIGRPNAGKSSVFNALVGFERAIVTDEAGTTRDVIEQPISCGHAFIRLLDTAGVRQARGKAEKMGVELSLRAAEEAAAVIWVFEGGEETEPWEEELWEKIARKPRLAVLNKEDIREHDSVPPMAARFEKLIRTSAVEGEGIALISDWLSSLAPKPSEGAMITGARQAALLSHAADCLDAAAEAAKAGVTPDAFLSDVQLAAGDIGMLLGSDADADLASEIFSRFCVGK